MEQLQTIKGKSITIPKMVNRYFIVYYDNGGWKANNLNFWTTPEDALQNFFTWQEQIKDEQFRAKYYKVIELELEIPFVPKTP